MSNGIASIINEKRWGFGCVFQVVLVAQGKFLLESIQNKMTWLTLRNVIKNGQVTTFIA